MRVDSRGSLARQQLDDVAVAVHAGLQQGVPLEVIPDHNVSARADECDRHVGMTLHSRQHQRSAALIVSAVCGKALLEHLHRSVK